MIILRASGRQAWAMPTFLALLISMFGYIQPVAAQTVPQVNRIVVVVLENHSYAQIIGNSEAPFINKMANSGATFVNSYAVAKPSQPNYLALYSGSTYGVTDNDAHLFSGPTLASTLAKSGKRFLGYAQRTTPRKHKPWQSFVNNASYGRYFSSFPEQFSLLPHVSFVVPNNDNNMHTG